MVNRKLLRSKLVAAGETFQTLAKDIGISGTALSAKVNGHTDFTLTEVQKIREKYKLSLQEVDEIFFI